jgi:hypothetical protein
MKVASIVVLVILLASCASSGLYNMSDDWCAAHSTASAARCPNGQERRGGDKDSERVANNAAQRND